jgi:hypothetical protein
MRLLSGDLDQIQFQNKNRFPTGREYRIIIFGEFLKLCSKVNKKI